MEHGLNTNLVHKWRSRAAGRLAASRMVPAPEFVPVSVLPAAGASPVGDIRIAIRRGGTTLDVVWPVSCAESCAQWLRELLR